jgi:hypothetical protein
VGRGLQETKKLGDPDEESLTAPMKGRCKDKLLGESRFEAEPRRKTRKKQVKSGVNICRNFSTDRSLCKYMHLHQHSHSDFLSVSVFLSHTQNLSSDKVAFFLW